MHCGNGVVMLYSKFISQSLKNQLDLLVLSTFESGLFDFWRQKILAETQKAFSYEKADFRLISLQNLKGIYIIFFVMLTISGFCCVFEIFHWSVVSRNGIKYLSNNYKVHPEASGNLNIDIISLPCTSGTSGNSNTIVNLDT